MHLIFIVVGIGIAVNNIKDFNVAMEKQGWFSFSLL
jgi:hypothetical protein